MFKKPTHPVKTRGVVTHRSLEVHCVLDVTNSYNRFEKEDKNLKLLKMEKFAKDTRFGRFLLLGEFRVLYLLSKNQYLNLKRCQATGKWCSPLTDELVGNFITVIN